MAAFQRASRTGRLFTARRSALPLNHKVLANTEISGDYRLMVHLRSVPPPEDSEPSLGERATADIDFIRSAMENRGQFTAVPGWGAVFMGTVGFAAAGVSSLQESPQAWLVTWLIAAAVAIAGGGFALERKASRQHLPLLGNLGRKFLLGLCPPIAAGVVLTAVLFRAELFELMPATWLLLYGAANIASGAYSVRMVPLSGAAFMLLGLFAACAPASWGTPLLALGFGGIHWIVGFLIARSHGG